MHRRHLAVGSRIVRELSAIAERRGLPCMVVSDDGIELTSHAVPPGVRTPGSSGTTSPREAAAEWLCGIVQWSLARRVSERHLFPSLAAARRIIEAWRTDYNTVRPHSSLGGTAPAGFTNRPRQGHMDTKVKFSAG